MAYSWTITKSKGVGRLAGISGPRNMHLTKEQIKAHPEAQPFRMSDEDKEMIVEGLIVMDDSASGFEPLDDYGMPGLGCVIIEYKEGGDWKEL